MADSRIKPIDEPKDTGRVEAFSDGVFAIAITLLILEIKVPLEASDSSALLRALRDLWPSYLAFVTSFATVGIMWINHRTLFKSVRRINHGLLVYNGLLLMVITFVPFPTALFAAYIDKPGAEAAAIVYSGTFMAVSIFYNLLWWHIAYFGKLLVEGSPAISVTNVTRAYILAFVAYTIAMLLALVNVFFSFGLIMLLAVYFALPPRMSGIQRDEP